MALKTIRITMADETEIDVTPTLEDTLAFETTLRRNKQWGGLQENGLKITPFRAWNCAKRTGKLDLSWDEFSKGELAAISVESVDEEEEGDDSEEIAGLGKDTRRARHTNSSSPSHSTPAPSPLSGSEKPGETPA